MKFLLNDYQNKNTASRRIFFEGSDGILDRTNNLRTSSMDNAPLNADLSGTINQTRVGIESTITNSENDQIVSDRVSEFSIARQREGRNSWFKLFDKASTYQLSAPTENWVIPDKAALEGLNPMKWLAGILDSKGRITGTLKDSIQAVDVNEESPLIYSQLSYHFLDNSLEKTINAVNSGDRKNVSLFALDRLEESLDKFLPKADKDFEDLENEIQQRNKTEEYWKSKIARRVLFWNNRLPQKLQAKTFRKQLENGVKQLKANIQSAREVQSRKVENIRSRIQRVQDQWLEEGDTESARKFFIMTSEIIQNPEEFLKKRPPNIQGFDWRNTFQCGKGEAGAVNFLDTVVQFFLNDTLDLPAIQAAHRNNEKAIDNIKARSDEQENIYKSVSLESMRDQVNQLEIEQNHDIPAGSSGTLITVEEITKGLQAAPLNINVQTEIFKTDKDIGIHRSPIQKFALISKYLLENPELLTSKDPNKSLPVRAIAYLKGYLRLKEDDVTGALESRTITEGDTPFARGQLILSSERLVDEAEKILSVSIPELAKNIGSDDRNLVDNLLNQLESLPANVEAFKKRLGITSLDGEGEFEENAIINKVTVSEKETFIDTLRSLDGLGKTINDNAEKIQQARNEYAKLLNIPDSDYIAGRLKAVKEGEERAKDVLESSEGGIVIKGGSLVAGFERGSDGSGSEGSDGGGSASEGGGLETSFTTFMRYIQDMYNDINKWKEKEGQAKYTSIPLPEDLRASALPMIESLKLAHNQRKKDIGIENITVENPNRLTLDEAFKLEMAIEANDTMTTFAEQILENYQLQQWDKIKSKPIGFELDSVLFSDTTDQTQTNALNAVLNQDSALRNVQLISTPSEEPNPSEVLYAKAEDNDGKKWWVKIVSPRLSSNKDGSSLYLYSRDEGMEQFMNPFQILPAKKGLILTTSVPNETLQNNPYYESLWGKEDAEA